MAKLRLIFVEDDYESYTSLLIRHLESQVGNLEIQKFETASSFVTVLPSLSLTPPSAIVLDVLLPWSRDEDPIELVAPSMLPVPMPGGTQVFDEFHYSPFLGGYCIAQHIRKWPTLAQVPIVFLTSAPPIESYLRKAMPAWLYQKTLERIGERLEPDLQPALFLQSLLSLEAKIETVRQSAFEELLNSVELKPGAFGVKIDLKKLARRKRPKGDA